MRVAMMAIVLGISSAAVAEPLESFENSIGGKPDDGSWKQTYTSYVTDIGVTEGTYALKAEVPAQAWSHIFGIGSVDLDALKRAPVKKLAIDLTMPQAWPGWTWQVGFMVTDKDGNHPHNSGSIVASGSAIAKPTTYTWDYSKENLSDLPSTGRLDLYVFNEGEASLKQATTLYMDNLRLLAPVPGPTTGEATTTAKPKYTISDLSEPFEFY